MKKNYHFIRVYDYPQSMKEFALKIKEIAKTYGKDFSPRRRYNDYIEYTVELDGETLTLLYLTYPELKSFENVR